MEKYLSVPEMMERLGIGRSTAYNLLKRADFPTARIGKRVIIPESALQKWLDNGGTESNGG